MKAVRLVEIITFSGGLVVLLLSFLLDKQYRQPVMSVGLKAC
jgi:hypothetical protein